MALCYNANSITLINWISNLVSTQHSIWYPHNIALDRWPLDNGVVTVKLSFIMFAGFYNNIHHTFTKTRFNHFLSFTLQIAITRYPTIHPLALVCLFSNQIPYSCSRRLDADFEFFEELLSSFYSNSRYRFLRSLQGPILPLSWKPSEDLPLRKFWPLETKIRLTSMKFCIFFRKIVKSFRKIALIVKVYNNHNFN